MTKHQVSFDYSELQSGSERRKSSGVRRWGAIVILHLPQSCHRFHTIAGSRRFSHDVFVDTHEGVVLQLLRNLSLEVMNVEKTVVDGMPA